MMESEKLKPIICRPIYPDEYIMKVIANKKMKRRDIIPIYADCIRCGPDINWGVINRAILSRYSESGLNYIKQKAWGVVDRSCRAEKLNSKEVEK